MTLWRSTSPQIWQGRDDSAEATNAKRIFQTIQQPEAFSPAPSGIGLIGFECDEGVKRNHGRPGAVQAPDTLRRALANLASHQGHERLVDMGSIYLEGTDLEAAQRALSDAVVQCQQSGMRTLVFGGGHETAWAHGRGVLDAFPNARVAIINLDAHLDLGGLLLEKGELTEAREHFAKASELNPKLAQPHNYLGKVLMREGNVSQAIAQFEEALRLHPDFPEAEQNLRIAKGTSAQSP